VLSPISIGEATLTVVVADAPTTILKIIINYQIYTSNAPPGTKYLHPLPAQTWYEVLKACFEAQPKKSPQLATAVACLVAAMHLQEASLLLPS
jgi:hypothetical protein